MTNARPFPQPSPDVERRDQAIGLLGLLETEAEREFVVLTELAKRTFGVAVAMYSVIDTHRHWVKASCGLSVASLSLDESFCACVVETDEMLIAEDLSAHPVFRTSVFVAGGPRFRFYAGIPLHLRAGVAGAGPVAIGTLCLLDGEPRAFDAENRQRLRDFAGIAEAFIEARAAAFLAARIAEERRRDLRQLELEQHQFRQAERLCSIGSWRVTPGVGLTHWSDGVFAIHERLPGELPSVEAALSHYPPPDRAVMQAALTRLIENGEPFDVELDFVTAKGNWRRVRSLGEPEISEGRRTGVIGVFQDITVRHRLEQSLRRVAAQDDLTQLPNRAEFNRVLDRSMREAHERGRDLALLLIDLDGFKAVNDRCGHLVGDEVLRLAARRLRAPYLADCFAARLGGDEFVLLVTKPRDCAGLDGLVGRLLADLRHTVRHGGIAVPVSGTIGIAWADGTVESRGELTRRADAALYRAKGRQRGTAETWTRAAFGEGADAPLVAAE